MRALPSLTGRHRSCVLELPQAEAALPGHRYRDLASWQEGRAIHRVDQRGGAGRLLPVSLLLVVVLRAASPDFTSFESLPNSSAKNLGYGEPAATAAPRRARSLDRSGREKSRDSGPGSRRAPPPPPIPTESGWPLSRGFAASVRARAAGRKSRGSAARPLRATFHRRSSRPPLCPLPGSSCPLRNQPGSPWSLLVSNCRANRV